MISSLLGGCAYDPLSWLSSGLFKNENWAAGFEVDAKAAGFEVDAKAAGFEVDGKAAGFEVDAKAAGFEVDAKAAGFEVDAKAAGFEVDAKAAGCFRTKPLESPSWPMSTDPLFFVFDEIGTCVRGSGIWNPATPVCLQTEIESQQRTRIGVRHNARSIPLRPYLRCAAGRR
ncbi:hypothetical protein DI09_22p60 [Mitosporidium daphniae]|uniref:Uncharacterized protein n=1 Tax=Mitosporidium daphniae TaxID=1485682 RepID=A0A098VW72_9MICR|nr:uncharacterized protein DI09_22p60 [Mitosporidium daphniae]KGG51981.1 hypothetical protein DI09_22p60 [Mitosporidium daphniae]|eukprot:XP_013238437.1 uncharacterized protein DI09_22p60 [Mitosporidium daphniae]